jgi:hypothetical protein
MRKPSVVVVAIFFLTAAFLVATDESSVTNWQSFVDGTYKIVLRCPAEWKLVRPYDVAPAMGPEHQPRAFGLDAEGGENNTAQQLCKGAAGHVLQPFGTNPTIRPMKVQGQSACLISPSADQKKMTGENDAELIVKYPQPVKIGDSTYSFLTLYADKNYIMALTRGLKFLAPDPENAPFLMEIGFDGTDAAEGVFKVGQSVVVTVTLRNNSDRVLRIPFSDRETDYRILLTDLGGETRLVARYRLPDRKHEAPAPSEPVTLNPHAVYQAKIDTGLQYQLFSPTHYSVHGQMKLPAELGPGLVNSNTLRLSLVAGQGRGPQSNQPQRPQPSAASPHN